MSIVYVSTQAEAEATASYLTAAGINCAAYHAGRGGAAKDRVYSRWLSGAVPVMAATVAFGMGIDAAGVRVIVHAGLPRSVEDYVQQVGRAGRDGELAWAHALVDEGGEDGSRLVSLCLCVCLCVCEREGDKATCCYLFAHPP